MGEGRSPATRHRPLGHSAAGTAIANNTHAQPGELEFLTAQRAGVIDAVGEDRITGTVRQAGRASRHGDNPIWTRDDEA